MAYSWSIFFNSKRVRVCSVVGQNVVFRFVSIHQRGFYELLLIDDDWSNYFFEDCVDALIPFCPPAGSSRNKFSLRLVLFLGVAPRETHSYSDATCNNNSASQIFSRDSRSKIHITSSVFQF